MKKMRPGMKFSPGDVILTYVQSADSFELKKRPALVLFEEFSNVVVAGITSNTDMQGIPLTPEEGAIKKSVIKLNYLYTISSFMIEKRLFSLSKSKKKIVRSVLVSRLSALE